MKNNTKVRLHLSKQLFESLTKQIIAESKKGDMSGGAYTEAVKAPKAKHDKAPKAEHDKAPKMHKAGEKPVRKEMETKVAEKKGEKHISEMEIPAGIEQAVGEIIDYVKANKELVGFLTGAGGITGFAKMVANSLKNDPEARGTLDKMTGAGSTKRDF